MKEAVCDKVRKSNACHCNHRNCYRSAHLPDKIGLIYFFFQFCNQFFYDWIKFFTCFIWYCLKCLIFSKQLFFKSKSCVPTELFSASGKSFSKNSELKLFMRLCWTRNKSCCGSKRLCFKNGDGLQSQQYHQPFVQNLFVSCYNFYVVSPLCMR